MPNERQEAGREKNHNRFNYTEEPLIKLRNITEESKIKTGRYRIWELKDAVHNPAMLKSLASIKIGPGSWRGVVLEPEIGVKLGDYGLKSVFILSLVDTDGFIHNGRITLIGRDIDEFKGGSADFCTVILLHAPDISNSEIRKLRRILFFKDEIEGFHLRSRTDSYRISIDARVINHHGSLRDLGIGFFYLLFNASVAIKTAEIIFITGNRKIIEKYEELAPELSEKVKKASFLSSSALSKLREDCDFSWDCGVCVYKQICANIREMMRFRKRGRPSR